MSEPKDRGRRPLRRPLAFPELGPVSLRLREPILPSTFLFLVVGLVCVRGSNRVPPYGSLGGIDQSVKCESGKVTIESIPGGPRAAVTYNSPARMDDFAGTILAARLAAGLTQAQVAASAGLTASYLSFLENRKKPPPSDEVVTRLARALRIPDRRLAELAHVDRAPPTLRRRLKSLDESVRRERRTRLQSIRSLLSPLLDGPAELFERAMDWIVTNPSRRRHLQDAYRALGRKRLDQADRVARLLEGLPARERRAFLEALPALAGDRAMRATSRHAPELRYSPPASGEAAEGTYLLAVETPFADAAVAAGDRVLVDPGGTPRDGDLVAERTRDSWRLALVARTPDGWTSRGPEGRADGPHPEAAWSARWSDRGLGVVTEVRRPRRSREGE